MNRFEIVVIGAVLFLFLFSVTKAYGQETNDPNNPLNIIIQYCIQHADRVAAGQNVTKDLVLAGILSPEYSNMTCAAAQQQHSELSGLEKILNAYRELHPN